VNRGPWTPLAVAVVWYGVRDIRIRCPGPCHSPTGATSVHLRRAAGHRRIHRMPPSLCPASTRARIRIFESALSNLSMMIFESLTAGGPASLNHSPRRTIMKRSKPGPGCACCSINRRQFLAGRRCRVRRAVGWMTGPGASPPAPRQDPNPHHYSLHSRSRSSGLAQQALISCLSSNDHSHGAECAVSSSLVAGHRPRRQEDLDADKAARSRLIVYQ